MDTIAFVVHLKITYHDDEGIPVTVKGVLQEARRIKKIICEFVLASTSKNSDELDLDMREGGIRPNPDGKFKIMQLGDNSANQLKSGPDSLGK